MFREKAFIWDLDGTLLDSYKQILESVMLTLADFGIAREEKEVLRYIVGGSVKDYLQHLASETGLDYTEMDQDFQKYNYARIWQITPAPRAEEILRCIQEQGGRNFVFTHRDHSAGEMLDRLKITEYFEEVLTLEDGFARKPDPQAVNFLLDKYQLDPESTYYVGDRRIDMECGKNAGIRTILYIPSYSVGKPSGVEDYVIHDFAEMMEWKF